MNLKIKKYTNLTREVGKDNEGFLDPYNETYLEVTTKLCKFMKKNGYIGIVTESYKYQKDNDTVVIEDSHPDIDIEYHLFNTGLNSELLFPYHTKRELDSEINLLDAHKLIKELSEKNKLSDLDDDIAFTLDEMFKKNDQQDPLSYYRFQDIYIFETDNDSYMGHLNKNIGTIDFYKFISFEDFINTDVYDIENEMFNEGTFHGASNIMMNISKNKSITSVKLSDMAQEYNIFGEDNPLLINMWLFHSIEEDPLEYAIFDDIETENLMKHINLRAKEKWEKDSNTIYE